MSVPGSRPPEELLAVAALDEDPLAADDDPDPDDEDDADALEDPVELLDTDPGPEGLHATPNAISVISTVVRIRSIYLKIRVISSMGGNACGDSTEHTCRCTYGVCPAGPPLCMERCPLFREVRRGA